MPEAGRLGFSPSANTIPGSAPGKQVLRLGHAPLEFDDDRLAADRVGAAVKNVRRRDAACQVALDRDVERVQHVAHAGHGLTPCRLR